MLVERRSAREGELSLLYSFHKLYNTRNAVLVHETANATRSFNTVEEIQLIQSEFGVLTRGAWRRIGCQACMRLAC